MTFDLTRFPTTKYSGLSQIFDLGRTDVNRGFIHPNPRFVFYLVRFCWRELSSISRFEASFGPKCSCLTAGDETVPDALLPGEAGTLVPAEPLPPEFS